MVKTGKPEMVKVVTETVDVTKAPYDKATTITPIE